MDKSFTRYLSRSGLVAAATMLFVGVIDLFKAYQKHDRSDAIAVLVIFFILMPAFALWARRLPPTGDKTEK